ncbi:hypothetical protein [Stenoxybacter acetivorans]|uniref:hypothetical protein n=1 Tax=Stenoxybacter acetivorans TaxID=422441 RepID=UPI0005627962|nr:hypothetical protein [Stenoxybacter acetivorans]
MNPKYGYIKDGLSLYRDVQQIEKYVQNGGNNLDGLNTAVISLLIKLPENIYSSIFRQLDCNLSNYFKFKQLKFLTKNKK